MKEFVSLVSVWAIPLLITLIPLIAFLNKVPVYEQFIEGAKEGFQTGVRIIPYLVAMLVAIGMFRAAGCIDFINHLLSPVLGLIGFPPELLPLAVMRPLSGSASSGILGELIKTYGPDSMIASMAATLYGSTETTFYVLAVYFGSVGIQRTRHAVIAGLIADITGVIAAVMICRWLFTP